MERRVAQRQVEQLVRLHHAAENGVARRLPAQFHGRAVAGIGVDRCLRADQRVVVDVGADKVPAVFRVADQRIDAIGADADVEHPDRRAARNFAAVAEGQQVGHVMQIVGPAGDRRAQVARRQRPAGDAVHVQQQGAVEHPHGLGVGKIDRLVAEGVARNKRRQLRAAFNQTRKIVTAAMPVARMQRLSLGGHACGRIGNGRVRYVLGHE